MESSHQKADINLDLKTFLMKFNQFKKKDEQPSDENLLLNLMNLNVMIMDFLNTKLKYKPDFKHDLIDVVFQLEVKRNPEDIVHHIRAVRHYENKLMRLNENILNEYLRNDGKMIGKDKIAIHENGIKLTRSKIEWLIYGLENCKDFLGKDFGVFIKEFEPIACNLHNTSSYESIKKDLLHLIKPIYPELKVYFFGSRINGLGNFESDLDIFLDVGTMFTDYDVLKEKVLEILNNVANKLTQQSHEWHNLRKVTETRVPTLKVYNVEKGIKCDISFSNGIAIMNTLLVRRMFELQPICHKICLYIKNWLTTTTIEASTCAFIMLAIFFLQIKKILPTIKQLQAGVKPFEIGPWECDFDYKKKLNDFGIDKIDDSNKNCSEYLIEFFNYFGNFRFHKFVVSPYCGKAISKIGINNSEINEFPRYAAYYNKNPRANTFDLSKSMCVQDPYQLNRNVTRSVTKKELKEIQLCCQETASMLMLKKKLAYKEVG